MIALFPHSVCSLDLEIAPQYARRMVACEEGVKRPYVRSGRVMMMAEEV
jgi:hypothetical protein